MNYCARRGLLLAITGIGLSACSPVPTQPTTDIVPDQQIQASAVPRWVTQPPQRQDMAYGVGSMEIYGNPDQAIKRASEFARADLISQLKVTVSAETRSQIDEFSRDGDSRLQKSVRQAVSSRIPTVTLDELKITDTYVDERYAYALASLDRAAATARLTHQLAQLEQQLTEQSQAPVGTGSKLSQLQAQLPALTLFAEHDQLSEQVALIAIDRQRPHVSAELQAYRQQILASLKALNVRVTLLDDGARIMRGGLYETLTAQGLNLTDNAEPDLSFDVSANLDSQQQDGNFYVFANARVNIRDDQGKVISSFAESARGISGLQQNALNKASEALAEKLADELASTLTERLN